MTFSGQFEVRWKTRLFNQAYASATEIVSVSEGTDLICALGRNWLRPQRRIACCPSRR